MALFVYRSILPADAARVFQWHERPGAILDLMPGRRWARIEKREGGLRDGGRITFSIGAGPFRIRWEARHFGFVDGRQFCDEQVRGPFALWKHIHLMESIGIDQTLYEDRVEYALPGGWLVNFLAGPLMRRALDAGFARRHQIVREGVAAEGRDHP